MTILSNLKSWWNKKKLHFKLWNQYHNPYYWWWKTRKYFKAPNIHFGCGKYHGYFGLPCRIDSYKGLQLFCQGLGWKNKYNSPRHEWDPIIALIFTTPWKTWKDNSFSKEINPRTGKHGFYSKNRYWIFLKFDYISGKVDWKSDEHTRSMATWEAILDVAVYNKNPNSINQEHVWKSGIEKNAHDITIDKNMKFL